MAMSSSSSPTVVLTPPSADIFQPMVPLSRSPKGGQVRSYTFQLKRVNLAVDGFSRLVWTVNGQYPGPIITANKGDMFSINVVNGLGDKIPSSVHWHGLDQVGSNWYDGVPGTTQCPIPDGGSLLYQFNLTQSGTYWYHSHYMAQYVDGLRGPIVIYDQDNDPYMSQYDYEYVLTMSDWYHTPTTDPSMLETFLGDNYGGGDPAPDSGEISGVGQYNCTISSNCYPKKYATYKVTKGKKYRFRLINTSAMTHFLFQIDNHTMQVIEMDGTMIKPYNCEFLPINIAQRYSVIINCNQPISNYWIRATMSDCSLGGPDPNTINGNSPVYNNTEITGILNYDGATLTYPTTAPYTTTQSDCLDPDDSNLQPINLDSPVPTDKNVTTQRFVITINGPPLQADINNSSYSPDYYNPSILKVDDGTKFATDNNAYSYNDYNKPIDIVLINTESRTHPFHLHGHSCWVIYRGGPGSLNDAVDYSKFNFDNPPFRDTFTIDAGSMTVIRYIADNPGCWLLHCHIEWHVEMGMVVQLIEAPQIFKTYKIPSSITALCNSS